MESDLKISVVVPTCRRNDLLAKCLERLAPARHQGLSYEVIVTDDDGSAREMVAGDFSWARWAQGPKQGPAANRNNGARAGRGEWVAFVDDDCLPQPNWLAEIARIAAEGRVDVIEGKTVIPDKVDSPFWEGIENLQGGVFWSCNLAVRRAVFLELGGFDEDFKEAADEDVEFAWRFRQRGIPSCFAPEAVVLHPVRQMSLAALWKKIMRLRWTELRVLKTRRAGKPTAVGALLEVFVRAWMTLLRTTWHLFSRHDPAEWRRRWFWQFWRWLTFPLLLPYLMLWQLRFRRMLNQR